MFCFVAITFTSPKVSVTSSIQVPRRENMGSGGFRNYIKSTQCFLKIDCLVVQEYTFFGFYYFKIFFLLYVQHYYGVDC